MLASALPATFLLLLVAALSRIPFACPSLIPPNPLTPLHISRVFETPAPAASQVLSLNQQQMPSLHIAMDATLQALPCKPQSISPSQRLLPPSSLPLPLPPAHPFPVNPPSLPYTHTPPPPLVLIPLLLPRYLPNYFSQAQAPPFPTAGRAPLMSPPSHYLGLTTNRLLAT